MSQFVVLTHDFPVLHWDFMLEIEGDLRTWRLARAPDESPPIAATELPAHRLAYLDYEGPVSGNRGEVRRWDRGNYSQLQETDDVLEIRLDGRVLRGIARFERSRPGGEWEFYFTPEAGTSAS